MRQRQEPAEVFFFRAAEQGHVGGVLGSAEDSAQGNKKNIVQVVANMIVAWIFPIGKTGQQLCHGRASGPALHTTPTSYPQSESKCDSPVGLSFSLVALPQSQIHWWQ